MLKFHQFFINFVRHQCSNSMNVKRYPLLNYFNSQQISRGNFAVIVTDSDSNVQSHCKKISSFIKELWTVSRFHVCTLTGRDFVNTFTSEPLADNLDLFNSSNPLPTVEQQQSELAIILQHTIEAIQRNTLNVSNILIASNKPFTIPQLFQYMQIMYASQELLASQNILVSGVFGHSYTCLIPRGYSELEVGSGHEGDYCGLIPLGKPVTLTTTGLVWNLNNQKLQFDLLISSSNQLDGSGIVSIKSDETVMWTMGVNCERCEQSS